MSDNTLQNVTSGPIAMTEKGGANGTTGNESDIRNSVSAQDLCLDSDGKPMPIESGTAEKAGYKPPYQVLSKAEVKSILIASLIALFLAALDQNVIVVALPKMVDDLGGDALLAWVVASYMLTSSATMAIYGRFSDVYGRREVYLAAVAIFFIGSALCGASTTIWFLIVARGVQGIGGGGLIALAMIVVGDVVEPAVRPKYLSGLTSVFGLASVLGPLLGGGLTDGASWRWIFWINLPLAGIAIVFLFFAMRKFKLPKMDEALDVVGCFLVVGGTICFVLFVIWGGSKEGYPWSSGVIIGLIIASVVLLILFLIQESRHPLPILNLRLFTVSRNYSVVMAAMFTTGFSMLGTFVYLPIYFQVCRGDSAVVSGLKLIPLVFGFLIMAGIAGTTLSKTGKIKGWVPVGAALLTLGTGLLSLVGADTNFGIIFIFLVIAGAGMGIIFPVTTTIVQNSVPPQDMANALSAYTFIQSMGGALGVAILGAIYNDKAQQKLDEGLNNVDANVWGLDYTFAIAAIPALITFVCSLFIQNVQLFTPTEKKDKDGNSKDLEKGENTNTNQNGKHEPTNGQKLNGVGGESLSALNANGVGVVHSNGHNSHGDGYAAVATSSSFSSSDDASAEPVPATTGQNNNNNNNNNNNSNVNNTESASISNVADVLSRDSVTEEDALVS